MDYVRLIGKIANRRIKKNYIGLDIRESLVDQEELRNDLLVREKSTNSTICFRGAMHSGI